MKMRGQIAPSANEVCDAHIRRRIMSPERFPAYRAGLDEVSISLFQELDDVDSARPVRLGVGLGRPNESFGRGLQWCCRVAKFEPAGILRKISRDSSLRQGVKKFFFRERFSKHMSIVSFFICLKQLYFCFAKILTNGVCVFDDGFRCPSSVLLDVTFVQSGGVGVTRSQGCWGHVQLAILMRGDGIFGAV